MIASLSGAPRLPRVKWRRSATRSLISLMAFIEASPFGDSNARRKQIEEAVELLRHSPLRCPVVSVKGRLTFRELNKHAASRNPFWGVREQAANDQPLAVLSTRDGMEAAIA